jgi:hypothetical protein
MASCSSRSRWQSRRIDPTVDRARDRRGARERSRQSLVKFLSIATTLANLRGSTAGRGLSEIEARARGGRARKIGGRHSGRRRRQPRCGDRARPQTNEEQGVGQRLRVPRHRFSGNSAPGLAERWQPEGGLAVQTTSSGASSPTERRSPCLKSSSSARSDFPEQMPAPSSRSAVSRNTSEVPLRESTASPPSEAEVVLSSGYFPSFLPS